MPLPPFLETQTYRPILLSVQSMYMVLDRLSDQLMSIHTYVRTCVHALDHIEVSAFDNL